MYVISSGKGLIVYNNMGSILFEKTFKKTFFRHPCFLSSTHIVYTGIIKQYYVVIIENIYTKKGHSVFYYTDCIYQLYTIKSRWIVLSLGLRGIKVIDTHRSNGSIKMLDSGCKIDGFSILNIYKNKIYTLEEVKHGRFQYNVLSYSETSSKWILINCYTHTNMFRFDKIYENISIRKIYYFPGIISNLSNIQERQVLEFSNIGKGYEKRKVWVKQNCKIVSTLNECEILVLTINNMIGKFVYTPNNKWRCNSFIRVIQTVSNPNFCGQGATNLEIGYIDAKHPPVDEYKNLLCDPMLFDVIIHTQNVFLQ